MLRSRRPRSYSANEMRKPDEVRNLIIFGRSRVLSMLSPPCTGATLLHEPHRGLRHRASDVTPLEDHASMVPDDPPDLIDHARSLRARGVTPKSIAKTLGITRAEADALVRRIARESATEATLVGCWVNAGWSHGLSWSGHPDWRDDDGDDDVPQLVSVVVAREHRYEK